MNLLLATGQNAKVELMVQIRKKNEQYPTILCLMEFHEDGECLVTRGGFCREISVVCCEFSTLEIGLLDNLKTNV